VKKKSKNSAPSSLNKGGIRGGGRREKSEKFAGKRHPLPQPRAKEVDSSKWRGDQVRTITRARY